MTPISRRMFLAGSVAVVITACSNSKSSGTPTTATADSTTDPGSSTTTPAGEATTLPTTSLAPLDIPGDPFTLGVASGDPDATSVVLWTRLAPEPSTTGGGMPDGLAVDVVWEASSSAAFTTIEHSGTSVAIAASAHSVHVVAELAPGTWHYRFRAGQYTSPVGTTRVAPPRGEATAVARFATMSCQHFEEGWYVAHRDLAAQRPDFAVFLGDYIYEDGASPLLPGGAVRSHGAPEPVTLDEYRNRYGLYKSDTDLQAAHAACPWFVIWDDHEVENDYASLSPQDPAEAGGFAARRLAAYQAWWEHMPVRLPAPTDPTAEYRIYRDAVWGDLVGLALLDGRQYRTDQACGGAVLNLAPACPEVTSPGRTMTGDDQERWLLDTLGSWGTTWNAVGNQTVMSDATFNRAVLNYDQWDGYPEQRARILQHLSDAEVANVVVLTGDIHLAAVGQLRAGAPGVGTPVGVELVTSSISSSGLIDTSFQGLLRTFPDLIDAELVHRGYILHTVTPQRWSADYRIVADAKDPASNVSTYRTYLIDAGSPTARAA